MNLFVCNGFSKDEVVVKISGKENSLTCLKDEFGAGFVCGDKTNVVLVLPKLRSGEAVGDSKLNFFAMGFSANSNNLQMYPVEKIIDGDKLLFSTNININPQGNTSLLGVYGSKSFANLFNAKLKTISDLMNTPSNQKSAKPDYFRLKGGVIFEAMFDIFKSNYFIKRNLIIDALSRGKFNVELMDGTKYVCSKVKDKYRDEVRVQAEMARGDFPGCPAMKCSAIDKKNKDTIYMVVPYSEHYHDIQTPLAITIDGKQKNKKLARVEVKNLSSPSLEGYLFTNSNVTPARGEAFFEMSDLVESIADIKLKMTLANLPVACDENNSTIKFFLELSDKHLNHLGYTMLAQFIERDGDNFFSRFDKLSEAGENYCGTNNVYVNKNAIDFYQLHKTVAENRNPRLITQTKAQELFNKAKAMEDIAWNYKKDGCFARAHLMCRRFEQEGIDVGKVWIRGDLGVFGTDIGWEYHVAPIVYTISPEGKMVRMVIDPSLTEKPVTVEEWVATMSKGGKGTQIFVEYPLPNDVESYERTAVAFSSSNPYWSEIFETKLSEGEKLQNAVKTMVNYKGIKK